MDKLSPQSKLALAKAQRDWVPFRDDNALVFAAQHDGGSMQSMVLLNVKMRLPAIEQMNYKNYCKINNWF
jgi:uncharacterized protein YecT (DUF1311 family)